MLTWIWLPFGQVQVDELDAELPAYPAYFAAEANGDGPHIVPSMESVWSAVPCI